MAEEVGLAVGGLVLGAVESEFKRLATGAVDKLEKQAIGLFKSWLSMPHRKRDHHRFEMFHQLNHISTFESPNKRRAIKDLAVWVEGNDRSNNISNHGGMPHAHGGDIEEIHDFLGYAPMDIDRANNFRKLRVNRKLFSDNNMPRYSNYRKRRRYGGRGRRTGYRKYRKKSFRRGVKRYISRAHEMKTLFANFSWTEAQVSTDGNQGIVYTSTVLAGTGISGRIGERIEAGSFSVKGILHSVGDSTFVRVVVFVQKKPQGLAPVITDLFESTLFASDKITEFPNQTHKGEYKILWDQVFTMDAAADGHSRIYFDKVFGLKGMKMKWDGTGGAIGDAVSNALHMIVVSDCTDASNCSPICHVRTRLNFRDM